MTETASYESVPCPDCGQTAHDPKTGFCWKSPSRNPRSGIHCGHCCKRRKVEKEQDPA